MEKDDKNKNKKKTSRYRKFTYQSDYDGDLHFTYINPNLINITYRNNFNEETEYTLERKPPKLMKGKVNGQFKDLKKLLIYIATVGLLIGAGVAVTYPVVKDKIEISEINDNARDSLDFHARSIDPHVQLAFLHDVDSVLRTRHGEGTLNLTDEMLYPELHKRLAEIEKNQQAHDEAIALGELERAVEYSKIIEDIIRDTTVRAGELGHVIGSSSYYPYLHAIYQDSQVMYLATDVEDNDFGDLDTRYHYGIEKNGKMVYYIPTKPTPVAEMHKVN